MKYAGADWIESSIHVECSDFGRQVADLLGDAFLGIYHLNHGTLRRADWTSTRWIEINYAGELATYDGNEITRLVMLAHDRCIRFAVRACNMQYVRLCFSLRQRDGDMAWARHPTIEDHVTYLRKHYDGKNHDVRAVECGEEGKT